MGGSLQDYRGGKINMHAAVKYIDTISTENEIWNLFLEKIKQEYGAKIYDSWFANLSFVSLHEGVIEIIAPNKLVRQCVLSNYYNKCKQILVSLDPTIKIIDLKVKETQKAIANDSATSAALTKKNWAMRLEKRFTFENFVTGDSNIMAVSAAKSVAETQPYSANVTYIYGAVGLGKTHLLQAIAHHIQLGNLGRNVLYLSAEKFMNHYVQSIRSNNAWNFKNQFADVDTLLIDDLQFICGKIGMQKEFNNVFNMLVEAGGSIVVAADRSPYALELEVRTKSRLVSGLAVEIKDSDYNLRLNVLKRLSLETGVKVDSEVLDFLANNITSSIRELVGAMQNLIHHAKIENTEINLYRAQDILKECILAHESEITIARIIEVVAQHYGITALDIISKSREARFVKPRQLAAFIAKQATDNSLKDIGIALGKRDHATIIYSISKLEERIERDKNLKNDINAIFKTLGVRG